MYQLLKQLRETGWNPTEQPDGRFVDENCREVTLEDLFAKLGNDFGALFSDGRGGYLAETHMCDRGNGGEIDKAKGLSIKEALIKLYIKLHKK